MTLKKLLIAGRGEIAIRVARAAEELGIATVVVFSEDDAASLHTRKADAAHALRGRGAAAYLDAEQLIEVARGAGCDAIHPGYGFLSENAAFARRCAGAGLCFVGPTPEQLELFGDKLRARALAAELGVPVLRATAAAADLEQARAFLSELGAPAIIKAVAGGGGRGMRVVRRPEELTDALARCQSEALLAFGNGAVYVEALVPRARHLEVQVLGDGAHVVALGERDCTLQRRHQKLIEIAPSPALSGAERERLVAAALRLADATHYQSLGTFEFLLDLDRGESVFIEANPRLQVEHPITEQVFGVDLVKAQLAVAGGARVAETSFGSAAQGYAIELRVNLESMDEQGRVTPAGGSITAYEPPSGPGVRVDGAGYAGYAPSPSFDSLLAKLIVHSTSSDFAAAINKARRALSEFRIEGVATNLELLERIVSDPRFASGQIDTTFIERHAAELLRGAPRRKLFFDELRAKAAPEAAAFDAPDGALVVRSPMPGRVLCIDVAVQERVAAGKQLAVLESMKMESAVSAPAPGIVRQIAAKPGESVAQGVPLFVLEPADVDGVASDEGEAADLDQIRADLAEVLARHAKNLDPARPDAVQKRRQRGQRTARENVADLCDEGSFVEYGALTLAAQRSRRSLEELIRISPADGVVAGIGTVNAAEFGAEKARCMVVAYDASVLAGTQGLMNHKKQDRLFEVAGRCQLPLVLLAEGGGGRPGDTDVPIRPSLDVPTFATLAGLSGLVPLVGVVSGRCFAGNAVLLGCCDVIIATENSNIGMGGPVMIEGAGLGACAPEDVGPIAVQSKNGVVDVRVADEAAATAVARQYLSYFQGSLATWSCEDQRQLRRVIPENRLRVYEMRRIIEILADTGTVLELRREFGVGMITALLRIEGRPFGVIANEPRHLSGAIDAEAADKGARFLQLCDAFDLPVLSLVDTPGFMVGPEAETTAMVRHTGRLFVAAANMTVPLFTVVVRKAYGLGAMSVAGGSLHAPVLTAAWPSAEFGAMGLEGAVLLAMKKQLEAIADPEERRTTVRSMANALREEGKAVNAAFHLEFDAVIDPAETRSVIARAANAVAPPPPRHGKKRAFIDTW